MVPENEGTEGAINLLLDHLQSLSEHTWPVTKEDIDTAFTTALSATSISEVPPVQSTSSQLNEDWREVKNYSRILRLFS